MVDEDETERIRVATSQVGLLAVSEMSSRNPRQYSETKIIPEGSPCPNRLQIQTRSSEKCLFLQIKTKKDSSKTVFFVG